MAKRKSIVALQDDPLSIHISTHDFAASTDLAPPHLGIEGESDETEELTRDLDASADPQAVSSSVSSLISVGINDGRLRRAEIEGLNVYLSLHGGQFQGHPLFRISWAADDNYGLLRSHLSTCPKRDPGDFDCGCPVDTSARIPLCFHPTQLCYHLLSWQPPTGDEEVISELTNPGHIEQARREAREGSYSCVMHFCDPYTGAPFNPTAGIIETIVPIIVKETERARAAMHGARAVLMRERAKRVEQIKDERARKEAAYDQRADDILRDNEPAFGGAAFAAPGEKHMQESDKSAGDAIREGALSPAPTLDGPAMTLGRIRRTA